MNIYEKMSAITIDINKVAKNLKVGVGQSQYKAVGEADILEAVKPVEAQHGIYSYPASRKVIKEAEYTTTSEYNGKVTERTNLFLRIETVYRFVNVENPEEYIDIIGYGDGVDTQDKAPGKAMTYSDKYCLMKAYKIETGDDPDQKGSEPMKPTKPVAEPKIEQKTMEAITELIALSESDLDKLLKHYKVKSLSDMTHSQGEDCRRKLNVKLDQMEAESQKEGYQQLDDVNLQ